MIKQFFQLWGAIQELLVQVANIKSHVSDDPQVIKDSLTVYKKLLSVGIDENNIDKLIRKIAMGEVDLS